jgi:hypothetical protein
MALLMACAIRWVSRRGGASSSSPTRSRLAISPTNTRQPGKPVTLLKIIAGPIRVGRATVPPAPTRL